PVGLDEGRVRDAKPLAIAAREADGSRRDIRSDDAAAWSLRCNRKRHRTRTAAQVEHRRGLVLVEPDERELHQELGFRPWNEHVRRDFEIQAEEFAPAGEIGDRFACSAPARQRIEGERLLAGERSVTVRGEPRTVAIDDVREQQLGLERHQAAQRQRSGNRRRSHRSSVGAKRLAVYNGDAHNVQQTRATTSIEPACVAFQLSPGGGMPSRREFMRAGGGLLLAGGAWAVPHARAELPGPAGFSALPAGAVSAADLESLPGKVPLIKRTWRPPNYETPM